ncbi:c-type heme family protein, partial [Aetokthonos hydrillicola]
FELEIIANFRKNNNLEQEMTGFRSLKGQDLFYIAHPLAITEAKCLRCHSTPDKAPKSMIQKYGTINGMGWKLNDINGAQIVFLPADQIFRNARQSLVFLIGLIAVIFAFAIFTANFWIKQFIVKPIKKVAQIAEAVSIGDMDAEFEKLSNDEIGSLAEAFTRMKISLTMAMKRFRA